MCSNANASWWTESKAPQKVPNGSAKPGPVSNGAPESRGTEPGTEVAAMTLAIPIIANRPFFSCGRHGVARARTLRGEGKRAKGGWC